MPTFDTPDPISARIDVAAGGVRVRATDRAVTEVTVRPRDERSSADVQAAEQATVTYADGHLLVRTTGRPRLLFLGSGGEVDVDVVLPEGSALDVRTTAGDVSCSGRLGAVALETRYGDLRLDTATRLRARTSSGGVTAGAVDGDAVVHTAYGDVRVGRTDGDARLQTSCGDVTVDRAAGSLLGSTRYGRVRVGEAVGGSVVLETAYGEVEAGIPAGTAAWLDLQAAAGSIRNELTAADGPDDAGGTVELRARTGYGDILVRRA
ncbi:DUF4097 family beta strand repeat-containing protein [Geodermatophilus saharensis]|uniref:DUF4097 family beta strand repeat-containing protein n=1 Tax=Geodermatophilus saharensis TaxID=1137994 RepID=UPI000B77B34E|nr:DUF4097 family beta strand repeat-containing protein [Geodermatophilus saharensis]